MFKSEMTHMQSVRLPEFSGLRIMMMPFHLHDTQHSIVKNSIGKWLTVVEHICSRAGVDGVGYLTIDEALVPSWETHRRPGLHVDGIGEDGGPGGYGGGGGYAGRDGMYMVASEFGCVGYVQEFEGAPLADGDCAHLQDEIAEDAMVVLMPIRLLPLGGLGD